MSAWLLFTLVSCFVISTRTRWPVWTESSFGIHSSVSIMVAANHFLNAKWRHTVNACGKFCVFLYIKCISDEYKLPLDNKCFSLVIFQEGNLLYDVTVKLPCYIFLCRVTLFRQNKSHQISKRAYKKRIVGWFFSWTCFYVIPPSYSSISCSSVIFRVMCSKRKIILWCRDGRFSGLSGGSPNEYEYEIFSHYF